MTGGTKRKQQISSEEVAIKSTKHNRWSISNFIMISTTATQTQTLPTAELLDVLECPVCKVLPRTTPIFQCENGHIYCNECKPNLRTCAVCRVPLGEIRSLICEQVIERLPMRCKYLGCEEVQIFSKLSDHEQTCDHRPINCVYISCNEKVAFKNILDHLFTRHGSLEIVTQATMCSELASIQDFSKASIKIEKEKFGKDYILLFKPIRFLCEGENFFLECKRHDDRLWYFWIYYWGTQEEANNFKCMIQLSHQDEKIVFCGKAISVDIPKENIPQLGLGMIVPDIKTEQCCNENEVLEIKFSVFKPENNN